MDISLNFFFFSRLNYYIYDARVPNDNKIVYVTHIYIYPHARMPLQAKSLRVQLVRDALNEILK